MSKVVAVWGTRREGNDGYVSETLTVDGVEQRPTIYGPMPSHIVPAFVAGRRQIINTVMTESGGRLRSEKFSESNEFGLEVERLLNHHPRQ